MKARGLRDFLRTGRRWNVFEWAEQEARKSERTADEHLRERLRDYYQPRVEFERLAGQGTHFHYGALNIGGMGSPRYGRYCVVDRRLPAGMPPDPVWLIEDSLRGACFHGVPGSRTWDRLAEWAAPHDMVAELAVVKFATTVAPPGPWCERLCNNDDYIEALSVRPFVVHELLEIRSNSDDEVQERALAAALQSPGSAEALDLAMHEEVRALAEANRIRWRSIP
ncbi:MAG: hypothetical protein IPK26_24610 [Planctomycetes bacterium]|nr:hypothetical protein [Planctomycetota bacterium]